MYRSVYATIKVLFVSVCDPALLDELIHLYLCDAVREKMGSCTGSLDAAKDSGLYTWQAINVSTTSDFTHFSTNLPYP